MTRDEWRNYICCVLTVREELIAKNRPLVQDLVNYVLGAGIWLDAAAARTATRRSRSPPAGKFFNQDPAHPAVRHGEPDRPRDLWRPAHDPSEFDELMQLSVAAGTSSTRSRTRRMSTTASPRRRTPASINL